MVFSSAIFLFLFLPIILLGNFLLNQKYPESIFLQDNFDLKSFLSDIDQTNPETQEKKIREIARSEFSLKRGIEKYYEVYKSIKK